MQISDCSYRLYNCACCAQQVRICRRCDRGNQYCAEGCAAQRRGQSLQRAGKRYQLSRRGARCHASRQRRWRERAAQKVTHQGCLVEGAARSVPDLEAVSLEPAAHVLPTIAIAIAGRVRGCVRRSVCDFCGGALPALTRLGPLRGGP